MAISWKGSISFGLIYIPISLYIAAKDSSIAFNQLHKECLTRIHYKKVCDECHEEVKSSDIVKGYNYEDDKYVIFTEDDFEQIKSPKDQTITITQFVNSEEISSIFYDQSYYVVPNGGEKAFALLKEALKTTQKVGIAKVVFGTKENLVALRENHGQLILNKLFFVEEIKEVLTPYQQADVIPNEVNLAIQLINQLSGPFKPEIFHDEYQEKLRMAIEQKISGEEIHVPKQKQENTILNLMDALQASLKQSTGPRV